MINLYDAYFWANVFHIFMFALLIYSIMHKIWEKSKLTIILIVGFQICGLVFQYMPIGIGVIYIIVFMCYVYYRAVTKKKKEWSRHNKVAA